MNHRYRLLIAPLCMSYLVFLLSNPYTHLWADLHFCFCHENWRDFFLLAEKCKSDVFRAIFRYFYFPEKSAFLKSKCKFFSFGESSIKKYHHSKLIAALATHIWVMAHIVRFPSPWSYLPLQLYNSITFPGFSPGKIPIMHPCSR